MPIPELFQYWHSRPCNVYAITNSFKKFDGPEKISVEFSSTMYYVLTAFLLCPYIRQSYFKNTII
jgi:hypothetical protein